MVVPYLIEVKGLSSLIFPEFQPLVKTVPYKRSLYVKHNKCMCILNSIAEFISWTKEGPEITTRFKTPSG